MKNAKRGLHILGALSALVWAYPIGQFVFYDNGGKAEAAADGGQAGHKKKAWQPSEQDKRDIVWMTANLLYEAQPSQMPEVTKDAMRIIATTVLNKKAFEGYSTIEATIKAPKQYSWVAEKGKSVLPWVLEKKFGQNYRIARAIAESVVMKKFNPAVLPDGRKIEATHYVTTDVYRNGKTKEQTWHREQVAQKKMCIERNVDFHVLLAPISSQSCRKNKVALF